MKSTVFPFLALLTLCTGLNSRTWTSSDGRQMEAELVKFHESTNEVTMILASGQRMTFPISRLSTEDQNYIIDLETSASESEVDLSEITPKVYDGFRIKDVDKIAGLTAKIHDGWETDIEALEIQLDYDPDVAAPEHLWVDFFDRDKKSIGRLRPRLLDDRGRMSVLNYSLYTTDERLFYAPIARILVERQWKYAVVNMWEGDNATYEIFPKGSAELHELDVHMKEKFYPGIARSDLFAPRSVMPLLSIHRIREGKSPGRVFVYEDKKMDTERKGIYVRVSSENEFPSRPKMKLYFYDSSDQIVFTMNGPSKTGGLNQDEEWTTTVVPQFARLGQKKDAFFAYPKALRGIEWDGAVAVYGSDREGWVAMPYKMDEERFEQIQFPEKSNLQGN